MKTPSFSKAYDNVFLLYRGTSLGKRSATLTVILLGLFAFSLAARNASGAEQSQPVNVAVASSSAAQHVKSGGRMSDLGVVGGRLFGELSLSATGKVGCATCHAETSGHADRAGGFLPLGGNDGKHEGLRSSPSIRYLDQAGSFRFNARGFPQGGLMWDGRFDDRTEQASGPLFNADEMANTDLVALANRLRALSYFKNLSRAAHIQPMATDEEVVKAAVTALARYQAEDIGFHAFTSKFDAVQDGTANFTAQEQHGLELFNDRRRGDCAACHDSRPVDVGQGKKRALFTNFRYFSIGVPRNHSVATSDPNFFDLGLCGPQRTDLSSQSDLCGLFRTPTLRNVALTGPYFHNASVSTLEEVVAFYATRDLTPERWYPKVDGKVQMYNDVPPQYRSNVQEGIPFRGRGGRPTLSGQDITDIVAFLNTLTDGYAPEK